MDVQQVDLKTIKKFLLDLITEEEGRKNAARVFDTFEGREKELIHGGFNKILSSKSDPDVFLGYINGAIFGTLLSAASQDPNLRVALLGHYIEKSEPGTAKIIDFTYYLNRKKQCQEPTPS